MKRNRKHNMFGWLAASALLLTTACTDNADLATEQGGTDGTNIVTLTVQTPSQAGGTRADGDLNTWYTNFGKASEVDILIFAVYEQEGNKESGYTYKLLENYSKDKSLTIDGKKITCGTGQNIISFGKDVHEEGVTIQLAIDPEKTYAVAFWAQSSKTKAYNTNDLKEVKVVYSNANNNDELRDAFCAVDTIHGKSAQTKTITLRRPLAQINVGTTGADYNNILSGAYVFPNAGLTQSKIVLKGVAQCFNVVENKVETDNNEKQLVTVTFDYANLPAFMYMTSVPDTETGLLGKTDITGNQEEFLYVDLDGEGITGYDKEKNTNGYKTEYSTVKKDEKGNITEFETETFKYLSMCYVLVPANEDNTSSTVEVEVWFKGNYMKAETETATDATTTTVKKATGSEVQYRAITLNNVPVQRNYRTNILGGLHDGEDPDPSSVFKLTRAIIAVCPCYDNDNNVDYVEKKENYWDWAPTPPLGEDSTEDGD